MTATLLFETGSCPACLVGTLAVVRFNHPDHVEIRLDCDNCSEVTFNFFNTRELSTRFNEDDSVSFILPCIETIQ